MPLEIIGTSHISRDSVDKVTEAILKTKPDIVAIELDRGRLHALLNPKKEKPGFKDIRRIGLKGFVFAKIAGWAEKKLGEYVGISPGQEMVTAAKLCQKNRINLVLIDQDIEITLKRLSKRISWLEKWHFVADIFNGVVLKKKEIEFDPRKVPEKKIIHTLITKVKKRYPNIYAVLIKERNLVLASRLQALTKQNPDKKILAIMGAGHEDEVLDLIKKIEKHQIEAPHWTMSFQT